MPIVQRAWIAAAVRRKRQLWLGKHATAEIGTPLAIDPRRAGTAVVNVYEMETCEKPLTPEQEVLLFRLTPAVGTEMDQLLAVDWMKLVVWAELTTPPDAHDASFTPMHRAAAIAVS